MIFEINKTPYYMADEIPDVREDDLFLVTIANAQVAYASGETERSAVKGEILLYVPNDEVLFRIKILADITGLATETYVDSAISAEASARDAAIQNAVSDEADARDGAIANAITDEAANRDTAIASAVADEATARDAAISAHGSDSTTHSDIRERLTT